MHSGRTAATPSLESAEEAEAEQGLEIHWPAARNATVQTRAGTGPAESGRCQVEKFVSDGRWEGAEAASRQPVLTLARDRYEQC